MFLALRRGPIDSKEKEPSREIDEDASSSWEVYFTSHDSEIEKESEWKPRKFKRKKRKRYN